MSSIWDAMIPVSSRSLLYTRIESYIGYMDAYKFE